MPDQGPHQGQQIYSTGVPLAEAKAAMILLHGRGSTATNILDLAQAFDQHDVFYLGPQAADNTWYPYRFLAPVEQNEPWLSSALEVVGDTLNHLEKAGIPASKVILGGFSQGACLAAEFVAQNARRYGGLVVFSGGLIGPPNALGEYQGNMDGTPVFLGCSTNDFHIPEERVHESATIFESMGALVTKRIYSDIGHTIVQDEIDATQDMIKTVVREQ